jgi:hypothetical protein
MSRELLSDDRVVRERWPVLYWANRLTLIGAALSLIATVALLIYDSTGERSASDRAFLNEMIGAAYVSTALLGVGFMVTGYLRLFMVHRLPGHLSRPRPVGRRVGLMQRLAGGVALFISVAAGWVHWGIGTALLFVVVFAVVYLPSRWR